MERAQAEIDRLQKAILVLQTEKEFVKSSYESGIAKYWEIEKQMAEMQEEVCSLQDQSGAAAGDAVIEDEEARALMTAAALKSCEEAIVRLKEQQRESADQARVESERIQAAIEQLNVIKGEPNEAAERPALERPTEITETTDQRIGTAVHQHQDQLDAICEKVKRHFEMSPETSVEEIAGKIDELVCKVIDLETTVSSLNTRISCLSSENGELERSLRELEEEKTGQLDDSSELNRRLEEAEEELKSVKELERGVKEEEQAVASGFTEVIQCFRNVSRKFEMDDFSVTENVEDEVNSSEETDREVGDAGNGSSVVIAEEDVKEIVEVHEMKEELVDKDQTVESLREEETEERGSNENALPDSVQEEQEEELVVGDDREPRVAEHKGDIFSLKAGKKKFRRGVSLQQGEEQYAPLKESSVPGLRGEEKEGGLSWQELLLDGLEGRDKILLADYTAILRSYKETTARLNEVEKRNQEQFGEMARLVQELRKDNAMKDEEIWSLKRLLSSFEPESVKEVSGKADLDRESDELIEEKLRLDIDSASEDHFEFMLKISASLNRRQEFETR